MPQGKGTYGSQVGRPPKKKSKYQSGGSVDPFSSKNPKGIIAQKEMEAIEEQNAMPTMNAMDRSQTSPMGGEVGTGMYKDGGKVDVTDIVKETEKPDDNIIGKHHVMRLMMAQGMSKEDIKRFSKEYKSPKEEKIGKMAKKVLKRKKK